MVTAERLFALGLMGAAAACLLPSCEEPPGLNEACDRVASDCQDVLDYETCVEHAMNVVEDGADAGTLEGCLFDSECDALAGCFDGSDTVD